MSPFFHDLLWLVGSLIVGGAFFLSLCALFDWERRRWWREQTRREDEFLDARHPARPETQAGAR